MHHVFFDTDVILDVLTGRLPHAIPASTLFTLAEQGKLKASVSSLSFGNIYYVLRRFATHEKVISRLKVVSELLCILPVDEQVIKHALQSRFKDFEDAIQYHTLRSEPEIEAIVTRNIKDYKSADLPVMTPETFLKTYLLNS
jgi:predicted nucleic acid-binding protein